jgi:hypothetical protein
MNRASGGVLDRARYRRMLRCGAISTGLDSVQCSLAWARSGLRQAVFSQT